MTKRGKSMRVSREMEELVREVKKEFRLSTDTEATRYIARRRRNAKKRQHT